MSISKYYNKIDALWKEFDGLVSLTDCTCEAFVHFTNHLNFMKLMKFLSGLDDTFSQVKSQILLMKPLPNIKSTLSIVSREESHQKGDFVTRSSTKTQAISFFW